MSGEYGGCGKTSHLSVSKYFFTILATWGRASWRRITLSCLCSYSGRFSRNGSNESIVADTDRNGIARFQQLIVNKILLIPPDTEHDLRTMNVRLWCWCWGRWQRLTRLSVIFFLLGVVVEYPLFISSHNLMQKTFSLLSLNQLFASEKSLFNVSRFQFIKHPISLFLNHSYGSQSYRNGLLSYSPMILQAPLAFDSDLLRVMPLIFCLRIFLAVQSEVCLQRWNLHPWNVEILFPIPYMIYQLEQYHHKLRQIFDGLQPHFSSN